MLEDTLQTFEFDDGVLEFRGGSACLFQRLTDLLDKTFGASSSVTGVSIDGFIPTDCRNEITCGKAKSGDWHGSNEHLSSEIFALSRMRIEGIPGLYRRFDV